MSKEIIDAKLIAQLIGLIKADGIESHQEIEFLERMAALLNIDRSTSHLSNETATADIPQINLDEKIIQFHRLVLLMKVDEENHPQEISYIKRIGSKMGLNPFAIEQILLHHQNSPSEILKTQTIIEILKKDLN